MIIFSIYLRVSEGMTPANLEIVASAVATADHHQLPYFILGDWNMTAKTIVGSGIVHQAAGRLMVPVKATCITSKSASTIDMGMLHQSLAAVVRGPGIREDIECYPHRGLSFMMAGPETKPMASELVVPKRLPVNRIIGPMNQSTVTTLLKEKVISHLGEVQRCLNDADGTGKCPLRFEPTLDSDCTMGSPPKIGKQFYAAVDHEAKIQSSLDVLWYHTGGLLWNQVAEMTGSCVAGPLPGEPFKIRSRPMLREHRPAQSWALLGKPWRWLHQRAHHIRSTLQHAIEVPHDWHYGKQEMEEICQELGSPPFVLDNRQQHFAQILRDAAAEALQAEPQKVLILDMLVQNALSELRQLKQQAEHQDAKASTARWKVWVDLAFVGGARPAHGWTRSSPTWKGPLGDVLEMPMNDDQILLQERPD